MAEQTTLDEPTRTCHIDAVLSKLARFYVDPEVAGRMEQAVRAQLATSGYDSVATTSELCEVLTVQLQAVSHDRHLQVRYTAEPRPVLDAVEPPPDELERYRQYAEQRNYGFEQVARLAGNIGYLDLRMVFTPEVAGPHAVAAMTLLANTLALIIDLRHNGGGHPDMVALLCSFLLPPPPVQINAFYLRDGDRTTQFWTQRYVPGPRYVDKPVYVLVSQATFSGGEEFAYDLQALGRATLIGETTAGGAHPVMLSRVDPHVEIMLPMGRPINPITGGNWEGAGVVPDIAVPSAEALQVAHRAALEQVLTQLQEAPPWQRDALEAEARQALTDLEHGAD